MAQLSGTRPHLRWNNEKDAWVATGKGGSPIFELPYRFTPTCEVTAGNPDRQMYLQRTHTAEITAGRSLTGIMVSQTFNGNADSGNIDAGEFKARGNTDGTYDLDGMRAFVANCDPKKTDVSGIARCIECVFENSSGSVVAEVRGIDVKLQASGTMTASKVAYFHGHSASFASYGLYIEYVKYGIYVTTTDAAGSQYGIKVSDTLTTTGAVAHRAIDGIVTYTPSTAGSGGSVPIGVAGKVTLSAGCTSTLYMWGIQGNLDFADTAVLNGSQVAAVRAVMTNTGSQTWTGGNIACLYCDNLIDDDISGVDSHIVRLANHGGAVDSMISFYVAAHTVSLFNFEDDSGIFTDITGGGVHGGTIQRIKVQFAGTTYYMLMSTAPTT